MLNYRWIHTVQLQSSYSLAGKNLSLQNSVQMPDGSRSLFFAID